MCKTEELSMSGDWGLRGSGGSGHQGEGGAGEPGGRRQEGRGLACIHLSQLLTVAVMWLTVLSSSCLSIPVMMGCELRNVINSPLGCFWWGVLSKQWQRNQDTEQWHILLLVIPDVLSTGFPDVRSCFSHGLWEDMHREWTWGLLYPFNSFLLLPQQLHVTCSFWISLLHNIIPVLVYNHIQVKLSFIIILFTCSVWWGGTWMPEHAMWGSEDSI